MSQTPIIIFGGTFDPIHSAHIALAQAIYDKFKIPITFLPTGIPPHKMAPLSTDNDRLAMLKLAIQGIDYFKINECEINSKEFCYTYLTLRKIRQEIGDITPLFFFIGSDSLESLYTWDNWQELFTLTNFILITRPGYPMKSLPNKLGQEIRNRITKDFTPPYPPNGKIFHITNFNPIDISSTDTRMHIKQHKSIDKLVPKAVLDYIRQKNLYIK